MGSRLGFPFFADITNIGHIGKQISLWIIYILSFKNKNMLIMSNVEAGSLLYNLPYIW